MPKVKVPRKSTLIDMTAMCDVAFLLLTFFILTAKFRPDQAVVIDMPASRSDKIVPEEMMTLSVDKDGRVFYQLYDQSVRIAALDNMIERYSDKYPDLAKLTGEQKAQFAKIDMWGSPIGLMPQVLNLKGVELGDYLKKQAGVPKDTADNQLGDWVFAGRLANPRMRIAIKGDKFTDVVAVQRVIKVLTERDINRFNLVTTLREGQAAATKPE